MDRAAGCAQGRHPLAASAPADEAALALVRLACRLDPEAPVGLFARAVGGWQGMAADLPRRRGRPFAVARAGEARAELRVAGALQEPAAAIRQGTAALVSRS